MKNIIRIIGIIVLFSFQALAIPFALLAGLALLLSLFGLAETDWSQIKVVIQSMFTVMTLLIGTLYIGTYIFSLIKTIHNKKVSFISWLPVLHIIVSIIALMVWGSVNQSFWMPGDNSIIASLPRYESSDCYYSEGFQDFTNYCKYYFSKDDVEKITNNRYLNPVTNDNIAELNGYFDDFESWIEFVDYKEKYDFKRDIIDTEDYFYIENDETIKEHKYWDYNVYFFDVQTKTLYFIHNNI